MVGSKWKKVKMALGLNLKLNSCLYVGKTVEDSPAPDISSSPVDSECRVQMPTTPTPSSSGLRLPKHSSKSRKNICAICLTNITPGQGHAIFTAECSHSFHFHCIASNTKHGKKSCPICRANWKEIPLQSPSSEKKSHRISNDSWTTNIRPPPLLNFNRQISLFTPMEPTIFDDDDELNNTLQNNYFTPSNRVLEVTTFPEVSEVSKSTRHDDFSVLIHLKAPANITSRAPVDLVTILDVSGSMAGTKLALLKRAMTFVVQNLGPYDRLSVIAFSSTARRLFPLRKMTDSGKQEAIQSINSLSSNGGTNIAEGLRKGDKVMNDRKWKNPVSSFMLLSDGQDTYTDSRPDRESLLPVSMCSIPIHTFGFGVDHDAVSMHSISEASGGTFSFVESEGVIQDAFAQCIGGILSVVVQELTVEIDCVVPSVRLGSIQSGSYRNVMGTDKRDGIVDVGDLYAEEERDFLVTVNIPSDESDEMVLFKVRCVYKNPVTRNFVTICPDEVKIRRPVECGPLIVSLEVDRQRNRLRCAEAMAGARVAAEQGDLAAAVTLLRRCRREVSESVAARGGDRLCSGLAAELREMEERMSNRQVYESSGRAYVLSGLSSHSWQRATARGDSTDGSSLVQAYQTPSMVDMVNLSQTMVFGRTSPGPGVRSMRPTKSFPARPGLR